ncbi:Regulatory protein RecX [Candidatus Desulfosporosinus infrequens]|uniref:Regulatory protein RecX n=1 Tax=Candidatus Desulfosporosinus infrequens TaxID=2043169 RepID=A0A2U3LFP0_9FIRM|nr:Regulatory protein RecX [Candidatus Desulfosporosinus infrequens]
MIHLTNSKPPKSAQEVAVDCLSRRALTHYELETRLHEKGYESMEVNEVLEKMEKLGYLNDQELALTVSQNRLRRYSRRRVCQDLQKRGIVPQIIEQALGLTYSSEAEFQQCVTLAERWWVEEGKRWEQRILVKHAKRSVPRELWLRQKVAQKLVQRGYPSDLVSNVLYQIQTNNNGDG